MPALFGALVLAGACGGDGDEDAAPADPVFAAVCEARQAAEEGDLTAARRAFDDAHPGLHDLAASVAERDRPAAAALLAAKERTEQAFAANDQPSVAAALPALEGAVRLARRGGRVPSTCTS